MTPNARRFHEANQEHAVIAASVTNPVGGGGKGGMFTLANTYTYGLTAADMASLPQGFPRWLPFVRGVMP